MTTAWCSKQNKYQNQVISTGAIHTYVQNANQRSFATALTKKKNLLTGESGVFGQDGLRLPISVAGGVSSGKGEGAGDALFCRLETGVNGEDSIAL